MCSSPVSQAGRHPASQTPPPASVTTRQSGPVWQTSIQLIVEQARGAEEGHGGPRLGKVNDKHSRWGEPEPITPGSFVCVCVGQVVCVVVPAASQIRLHPLPSSPLFSPKLLIMSSKIELRSRKTKNNRNQLVFFSFVPGNSPRLLDVLPSCLWALRAPWSAAAAAAAAAAPHPGMMAFRLDHM